MLRDLFPLARKGGFLLVHAAHAEPAHVLVLADLVLGELPVLTEYDVETHPEDAERDDGEGQEEDFHGTLEDELGADGLVVINFPDDGGEGAGHAQDLDLAGVHRRVDRQRNGVGDEHLGEFGRIDAVVGGT